jgi:hypothetical protein
MFILKIFYLFKIIIAFIIKEMNSKCNNYKPISNFGSNAYSHVNNPLSYCLNETMDNRFLHGGQSYTVEGQHTRNSQAYFSEYCANGWDQFCEVGSRNTNKSFPNNIQLNSSFGSTACVGLTAGEILIYNTASKKYLINMIGCRKKYEPFDPNVATSPMISFWVPEQYSTGNKCVPIYSVDPNTIDDDIVMDKILHKPQIAMDILINIYSTMKRNGTLSQLKGTKIGNFYDNVPYFKSRGGLQ